MLLLLEQRPPEILNPNQVKGVKRFFFLFSVLTLAVFRETSNAWWQLARYSSTDRETVFLWNEKESRAMQKGLNLLEFLEQASEAGLLPRNKSNDYYQSEYYNLDSRKKCLEILAVAFGTVYYESLIDLLLVGLGFEFDSEEDIKTFLFGVKAGQQLNAKQSGKSNSKPGLTTKAEELQGFKIKYFFRFSQTTKRNRKPQTKKGYRCLQSFFLSHRAQNKSD